MTWLHYVGGVVAIWLALEIIGLLVRARLASRRDWRGEGNTRGER